jgi:vaccinia related kinase
MKSLFLTCRDAHIGAFSRRGDLEILGYNMLEWLFGKLPWSRTETPEHVHKQKCTFMSSVGLKKIYPGDVPGFEMVEKYLKYVATLGFSEKPNYNHCREILKRGLPNKLSGLFLEESPVGAGPKKKRSPIKVLSEEESESESEGDGEVTPPKKIKLPEDSAAKAKR